MANIAKLQQLQLKYSELENQTNILYAEFNQLQGELILTQRQFGPNSKAAKGIVSHISALRTQINRNKQRLTSLGAQIMKEQVKINNQQVYQTSRRRY